MRHDDEEHLAQRRSPSRHVLETSQTPHAVAGPGHAGHALNVPILLLDEGLDGGGHPVVEVGVLNRQTKKLEDALPPASGDEQRVGGWLRAEKQEDALPPASGDGQFWLEAG